MAYRLHVIAALLGAAAAQPDNQCATELMAVTIGGAVVSEATCTTLAAFEGCVARVTDRATQSALEVALSTHQGQMQGCTAAPMTAAIRTARDEVEVTGAQILFARTVRQVVNVHELQEQVDTNEEALSASISSLQAGQASTLAANTAVMQSRMDAAASTATSTATSLRADVSTAQSSLAHAISTLTATTSASVSTSAAATDARINSQLSAASAANAITTQALNVSVRAALAAANNAMVPTVYVQWGAKACTAASGAAVTKLYDGVACGSRHNYAGSAGNQMCLKNAAGAQGGVRQGGQNSNDMVVPLRRSHAGYNGLPSRNNLLRSRDDRIIPCAKCKYAKSCFMEAGVAECPSGYHKMYTGYLFGGHQGHHGSNDRICIDKNPADNDYTSSGWWEGVIYPSMAPDSTSGGLLRNNKYILACHQCCVH